MLEKISYSFLTIGKTKESTDTQTFKRYIGLGASHVVAINPTKEEANNIFGTDTKEMEYVVDGDNGKEARIHFIVKTDPEQCNGVEMLNRLMFTLRPTPAYNKDQTKVQVIDAYGNTTWASVEDAKAGKKLFSANGAELKIDSKYRMAFSGEADLVGFLKTFLRVGDVFDYKNGSWIKKPNAEDFLFSLEHIKDYFKGDFSELKEAIAMQPNNKVKLLYGVRSVDTENGTQQYQAVAARADLILSSNAGAKALERLEKNLANVKASGSYATTDFRVCELQEWEVTPTNLEKPADDPLGDSELPWD